jgi:hypothetical protein
MNQNDNPFAAPRAEVRDMAGTSGPSDIASLPVPAAWKVKFHLIERAGGVKLPRFRELKFGERMKVNFNVLAFLFGPIYYAIKGMWRKGLAMFVAGSAVVIVLAVLLELAGFGAIANALGYGVSAFFAVRANIDYYKKMVLHDNGWW